MIYYSVSRSSIFLSTYQGNQYFVLESAWILIDFGRPDQDAGVKNELQKKKIVLRQAAPPKSGIIYL
jgi:hypothetical protein